MHVSDLSSLPFGFLTWKMRIIFHALFTSPGYKKLKNERWLVKNKEEKKSKRPLLVDCLYSDTEVPECMSPAVSDMVTPRVQEVRLHNTALTGLIL